MKKMLLCIMLTSYSWSMAQLLPMSFKDRLKISSIEKQCQLSGEYTDQQLAEALLRIYRNKDNLYLRISEKDQLEFQKKFPQEIKRSIEVADQVQKKYFLFRYEWDMEKTNVPYEFKDQINWSEVPFGDKEWCWMLNRHCYWIDLGKAYFFTKNEAYAQTWVNQVTDWIQKNPVSDEKLRGFSWRRIEAGIRMENWIKSFEFFKNSSAVTPTFLCTFLNSIAEHADFINSTYTDFSRTSNWGVLEYHGLLNAALFLTDFTRAERWKESAVQRLETCIQTQVLPDGTQWEQSPMYHNEVFHCFMNVNLLAQRYNIQLPSSIVEKTKAMAMANVKWSKPNHHQPLIGDSDDSDLRTLLTTATCIFNDGLLKSFACEKPDYDNCFVMGTTGIQAYQNIALKKPDFQSTYLQSSGDMIMRSGWDESDNYLSFHLKKLGCGHAHDNLLHITLFANGQDYLVDGGRFTYVDGEMRKQLKSSQCHNTLAVDDQPNSVYAESWSNKYNARSQGIFTRINDSFDYAEAENTAYKLLDDPVSMKRRILFIKPGLWIFFDSFAGNKKHRYSQYFNFADTLVNAHINAVSTAYPSKNLTIKAVKPVEVKLEKRKWSPEYNLLKNNIRAEFWREATGFSSFITLMYFPDKSSVSCTPLSVTDRTNAPIDPCYAEALEIKYNQKEYILLVVHDSQSALLPFYKVKDLMLTGEVTLLEKVGDSYKRFNIRE